jgi:hypothetical protein
MEDELENKIRKIAQEVVDTQSTANQFAVSDTSFHTHNGMDSQQLRFTKMSDVPNSYHGKVGYVATVNSTETGLEFDAISSPHIYWGIVAIDGSAVKLPTGWTSTRNSIGDFTVTHNLALGADSYAIVANSTTDFGINKNATIGTNSFEIVIVDYNGNLLNTGFVFILTY